MQSFVYTQHFTLLTFSFVHKMSVSPSPLNSRLPVATWRCIAVVREGSLSVSTGFGWTWMKRLVVSLLFHFLLCQMTSQSPLMLPLLSFQQPTTSLVLIKEEWVVLRLHLPYPSVQFRCKATKAMYSIQLTTMTNTRSAQLLNCTKRYTCSAGIILASSWKPATLPIIS